MEIHNVSGCMAFSLNVDGEEEIDMDNKQRAVVIDNIYSWMQRHPDKLIKTPRNPINLLFVGSSRDSFGEYRVIDGRPCECCGDITETVLNLDD